MFWSIFGQSLALILAIVIVGSVIAAAMSRPSQSDDENPQ